MKRAMSLMVVAGVLLFSQLALGEMSFKLGEPTLIRAGDANDQGLPDQSVAAGKLKITPLQAFTHTDIEDRTPWAWWAPDDEFCMSVWLNVSGSGYCDVTVKVTDLKTKKSAKYKMEMYLYEDVIGVGWGPSAFFGEVDPSNLPRIFKITFSFKAGSTVKNVPTYIMLRE